MLADCGEERDEGERYAFLAPDNQTGDPSLDWATAVIHRGLAADVGYGSASDSIAEARLAPGGVANRLVYSTLTRADNPGEVKLHSVLFDASGHQFDREFTVTGNVLQVINRMATSIYSESTALGAKSEEELRKWPILSKGGDLGDFESQCQMLAETSRAFGAAIASCAEQLKEHGRLDGLRGLMARVTDDQVRGYPPDTQDSLGQSYWALKDYNRAAVMFRIESMNRPAAKNMVGYSEALAGRYESGKLALEDYARSRPKEEGNALDSLGEIAFFAGRYKEAEQYFLASDAKWAANNRGLLEPMKAAAARSMAGDAAGANQLANAQIEKISKSNPQGGAGLKPVWAAIAAAANPEQRRQLIEGTLIRRP